MKRLAVCGFVLLAACPPKTTTAPQQHAGAGCPAAGGVFVASYVTMEPGKGRSGWVVPLHSQASDGSTIADYVALDATSANNVGVPPAPQGTLWLATANAAPCKVKVGSFYAAKVDGPPVSVSYGVELDGCPAPANPEEGGGIVLVSTDAPTGCRFEPPQPIAARLGEMDAQKQWQRPTKETPLPQAIASAIPPHTCTAPECETLYAFGEVKVGDQPVAWSGAINWLAVGAPADQCNWKAERFSGFFVPGPAQGSAVKVTEGQQHPLVLSAALVDGSGAKVLLAEGPGEYATYDLVASGAKLGHHITWMVAPDEAWDAVDHLGPICEPPAP